VRSFHLTLLIIGATIASYLIIASGSFSKNLLHTVSTRDKEQRQDITTLLNDLPQRVERARTLGAIRGMGLCYQRQYDTNTPPPQDDIEIWGLDVAYQLTGDKRNAELPESPTKYKSWLQAQIWELERAIEEQRRMPQLSSTTSAERIS
jgi:hypothetical protein